MRGERHRLFSETARGATAEEACIASSKAVAERLDREVAAAEDYLKRYKEAQAKAWALHNAIVEVAAMPNPDVTPEIRAAVLPDVRKWDGAL